MPCPQGGGGGISEDGLSGRAFGAPGDLALKNKVTVENSDQGKQRLARGASVQMDMAVPQSPRGRGRCPLVLHRLEHDYKAKQFGPCKHAPLRCVPHETLCPGAAESRKQMASVFV